MSLAYPVDALSSALFSAVVRDLPDVEYQGRVEPGVQKRRPYVHEVQVYMFPQTWGSTSLGWGGVGGQTLTPAYTTVVICEGTACVYFNGQRAYIVENFNKKFLDDLAAQNMAEVGRTAKYRKPD